MICVWGRGMTTAMNECDTSICPVPAAAGCSASACVELQWMCTLSCSKQQVSLCSTLTASKIISPPFAEHIPFFFLLHHHCIPYVDHFSHTSPPHAVAPTSCAESAQQISCAKRRRYSVCIQNMRDVKVRDAPNCHCSYSSPLKGTREEVWIRRGEDNVCVHSLMYTLAWGQAVFGSYISQYVSLRASMLYSCADGCVWCHCSVFRTGRINIESTEIYAVVFVPVFKRFRHSQVSVEHFSHFT